MHKHLRDTYGVDVLDGHMAWGLGLDGAMGGPDGAVLWVIVAEEGQTRLIVDAPADPYVLQMLVAGGGVVDLRLQARERTKPLTRGLLRQVGFAADVADLASLADLFMDRLMAQLETGASWEDLVNTSLVIEGKPVDALQALADQLKGRAKARESAVTLERVVEEYRKAVEAKERAPRRAVAERLNYSEGHIARLLVQARDKGLLGKTVPGKKGEL